MEKKEMIKRAVGAPEIEEYIDLQNRRDTSCYYGNYLNIYRASQSIIIRSAYDRGAKVFLASRHYFQQGTEVKVIADPREQRYELAVWAGNIYGRFTGKLYEVRKCGGNWNLDDYKALSRGRIIYS
jgi:hypothetical protein